MPSIMQGLLHIARSILEGIIDEVRKHAREVQDVEESIKGQYLPLTETFIGPDGDAYRERVHNVILPLIAQLIAAIFGIAMGVENAHTTIEQTDNSCASQVEDLANTFRSIF